MALTDFPRLPRPGQYQTRAQRLNRLDMLTSAEVRRLQARFRQEATQQVKGLGRADALRDRFAPPRPDLAERFRTTFQVGRPAPAEADLFTPRLNTLIAKAKGGAALTENERVFAQSQGMEVQPGSAMGRLGDNRPYIVGYMMTPAQQEATTRGVPPK